MHIDKADLIIEGIESDTDAVFTTDLHGAFNVSRIYKYAVTRGVAITAQLNVANVMQTMLNCDLDMQHSIRLMALLDHELYAATLALYIQLDDGTHMLIDGNHRIAETARRAAYRGQETIEVRALVITLAEAQQFRIRYYEQTRTDRREISSAEMLAEIQGVYSDRDGTITDMRGAA
jgi:hypothetical protein